MKNQTLIAENRSAPRINDRSRLYIRGFNAFGVPFSEVSEIIDISEGGISWLMDSPVCVDSVVYLDIFYMNPKDPHPVLRRKGKARVLRVSEGKDGHFVAACFEGESSNRSAVISRN